LFVAVDDSYVYWADVGSGSVGPATGFIGKLRLPISPTGTPPVIPANAPIALVSSLNGPDHLIRAGTSLYWTAFDAATGAGYALMTASTDGSAITTLARGLTAVTDLFANGASLYWLSEQQANTQEFHYVIMKLSPR
jgi:hypothetical protein